MHILGEVGLFIKNQSGYDNDRKNEEEHGVSPLEDVERVKSHFFKVFFWEVDQVKLENVELCEL